MLPAPPSAAPVTVIHAQQRDIEFQIGQCFHDETYPVARASACAYFIAKLADLDTRAIKAQL